MPLLRRNIKIPATLFRFYSTPQKDIQKMVYISQSKDIFTNLALEDWLYKNRDFTKLNMLMLWQNDPCVVIGRHQNPWLEANLAELHKITDQGVQLARRNSGGGTVYHDEGNLNMTFFTSREHYNRRHNLEIVTRALFKEYGVQLEISPREDLVLRNRKISGTAAKLGRPNAYHHCTLLINTNKNNLRQALKKMDAHIETNATKSIKSEIINFYEEGPKVDILSLYKVVGAEYLGVPASSLNEDDGDLFDNKKRFVVDTPTKEDFPGLEDIRDNLLSWQWRFGKTPKFTITHSFTVPDTDAGEMKVTLVVEGAKIVDANLVVSPQLVARGFTSNVTNLIGHTFSEYALDSVGRSLEAFVADKRKIVEGIRQEMQ